MATVQLSAHLESRIKSLYSLRNGWYGPGGGQGNEMNKAAMEATKRLLIYSFGVLPEPAVFPGQDGSISIEWQSLETTPLIIDVHEDYYDFAMFINGSVDSLEFAFGGNRSSHRMDEEDQSKNLMFIF